MWKFELFFARYIYIWSRRTLSNHVKHDLGYVFISVKIIFTRFSTRPMIDNILILRFFFSILLFFWHAMVTATICNHLMGSVMRLRPAGVMRVYGGYCTWTCPVWRYVPFTLHRTRWIESTKKKKKNVYNIIGKTRLNRNSIRYGHEAYKY